MVYKVEKGAALTQQTTNEKCTKKSVFTFYFFRVSFQVRLKVSLLADPCTMKPCMFQKPPALISLISIVSWIPLGEAAGQCNFRGSDYGKMLTGHTYGTFKINRPSDCLIRCKKDPGCQSYNYKLEEKICELNNRSKETRPQDYITDLNRIYMTVKFIEGMFSRTPASIRLIHEY